MLHEEIESSEIQDIYKNCFAELLLNVISHEEYRKIEQDAKVKTEFILLEMKQKL